MINQFRFKKIYIAILCFCIISCIPTLQGVTSISQFGITWKFAEETQSGRFANGDYWVIGPVTIIGITPASTVVSGRTMNGAMVNPTAGGSVRQGFDSAMQSNVYNPDLNRARPGGNDLSADNPLVLEAGSSLISTISHPTPSTRPQLTDAAILTVLAVPPPDNAFRPAYCGNDKAILASEADIDYSKVASLAKPASTPGLSKITNDFARPWIEINTGWTGGFMHPSNNQPDYGRDISKRLSVGLLSLQLEYSDLEKRDLMVRLVQYGLDIYGSAVNGGKWFADGGHNPGRKMPLLLAATVLNKKAIRDYGNREIHNIFQEDLQTFYVSQADVDITNSSAWKPDLRRGQPESYTVEDIGLPEWGIRHHSHPTQDNKEWSSIYRDIASSAVIGHVLTAHIMGLKTDWNWDPLFDYMDRYWEIEKNSQVHTNSPSKFERDMWISYRNHSRAPSPPNRPRQVSPPSGSLK